LQGFWRIWGHQKPRKCWLKLRRHLGRDQLKMVEVGKV
jgi:hypothetical protein